MRTAIRIQLTLSTLALLLLLPAPPVQAARRHGGTRGAIRRTQPSKKPKILKISKPYLIASRLQSGAIPLGNYKPRALRVFGKRRGIIGCPGPAFFLSGIRKQLSAIRLCYRNHVLKRHPKRGGRVTVRFTIGLSGRVIKTRVLYTALRDKPTERCLQKRLRAMRFPKPDRTLHVVYPFLFKPR